MLLLEPWCVLSDVSICIPFSLASRCFVFIRSSVLSFAFASVFCTCSVFLSQDNAMCSHSTNPPKDVDPTDHGLILTMINAGTLPYGRFLIPCAALSLLVLLNSAF